MNVIGILGNAGSGKDTVARMIVDLTDGTQMALADPLKEFARAIFQFSKNQLWGPSEFRNAPDRYYSADPTKSFTRHVFNLVTGRFQRYKEREENWLVARQRLESCGPEWLEEVLPNLTPTDALMAMNQLRLWFATLSDVDAVLTPRLVLQTLGTEFGRKFSPDVWIDYGLVHAGLALDTGVDAVVFSDIRFLNEAKRVREEGGQIWRVNRPSVKPLSVGVKGHASEEEQKSKEMDQYVNLEIDNSGTLTQLGATVAHALESYTCLPSK